MYADIFNDLDKQKAKETIDTLISLMEEWALQYPSVRIARASVIAFNNAMVVPYLDLSSSLLLAKLVLWISAADDAIDEHTFSVKELRQSIIERNYLVARDGLDSEIDDELLVMLADIRGDLSRYAPFETLREDWATSVRLHVEGMVREYEYALHYSAHGRKALPSFDEYMPVGMYGLGVTVWAMTLLIILGDHLDTGSLEAIDELVRHASAAIRLYNDVQTFEKEKQEDTISSVDIVYQAVRDRNPNISRENALAQAKQHLWQIADSHTQKCYALANQSRIKNDLFAETLCRLASFHRAFYSEHDYHTTPATEIYQLLGISGDVGLRQA
jgi:hypothetical protein